MTVGRFQEQSKTSKQLTQVGGSADHALSELVHVDDPGVAEVAQLDQGHRVLLCEEDVLWFQVAVNDSKRVQILQGEHDLGKSVI